MENFEKNQETEMIELSREELKSLYGGVTYKYYYENGKIVCVKIDD